MLVVRPRNKSRQCAPAGPDVKTAARFQRRCGNRYIPNFRGTNMKTFFLLTLLLSVSVFAEDRHLQLAMEFDSLTSESDHSKKIEAYVAAIQRMLPEIEIRRSDVEEMVYTVYSSEVYKKEKIKLYKDMFSEEELSLLIVMVKNPAYKILKNKQPEMIKRVSTIVAPILNKEMTLLLSRLETSE